MELNKIFERVLKETNSQELYIRKDPDSEAARYSPESGDDIDVGAFLNENGNIYNFIWRRSKSNLNLANHGFTHYVTRLAYADEKRIIEGQKIGKDIVDLKTEDENKGILCSMPIKKLSGIKIDDCYYKEEDFPLSVLLLVRQRECDDGKIRLITCYPTNNSKYVKWYTRHYYSRPKIKLDSLNIDDIQNGAQKRESFKRLMEREDFRKSAKAFNDAVEDLIQEMEENLLKGYQTFLQFLK